MTRYDAERMELSTRDRVALANYTEITQGRGGPHGGVFLDVSHIGKEQILKKLPRMYRQFIEYQMLDISRHPMEVAPTAHYSMGGVVVDPETHATEVAGLFAAGETTSGLHGANRLGGNSLTETLVFGRRAGAAAAARAQSIDVQVRSRSRIEEANAELDSFIKEGTEFVRPLQRALRDNMWEHCGVVRSEQGLKQGLQKIEELKDLLPQVDVRPTSEGYDDLGHALNLRGSLFSAQASLLGAVERRETRGAHNRSDYPQLDEKLTVNLVSRLTRDGEFEISAEPVAPAPEHLSHWAKDDAHLEAKGRLLE